MRAISDLKSQPFICKVDSKATAKAQKQAFKIKKNPPDTFLSFLSRWGHEIFIHRNDYISVL